MHVLIAEDEFATTEAIRQLVSRMGHTATWACSGPETLHILQTRTYQLLILSTQLRGADIKCLLALLRRDHPDLPVVALTARNSHTLEQQVRELGVIYYLIKPINIDELGSIVSHVSRQAA